MFCFPDVSENFNIPLIQPKPASIKGCSIDSRSLKPGDLFFALRGNQGDGHSFLEEAFKKGAAGAVINAQFYRQSGGFSYARNLLLAENPEIFLRSLSTWYRQQLKIPVMAITGSVGKTTTKDFLRYILSKKYKGTASAGNFNNHLGLPLTLLSVQPEDEYLICEMGANHLGEISSLCKLAQPSAGILTCVAPAHLEGFGSLENIYEAKLELFTSLENDAPAIYPDDDEVIAKRVKEMHLRASSVGCRSGADYHMDRLEGDGKRITFRLNGIKFTFPGNAPHNARNAAMALALCDCAGLYGLDEVERDWDDFIPAAGRFHSNQLSNGVTVVDDTYNASPLSFEKAIDAFTAFPKTGKKIVVIGDMLELGAESLEYHRRVAAYILSQKFDQIWATGPFFHAAFNEIDKRDANVRLKTSLEAINEGLLKALSPGDAVLCKGSRSMRIDKVVRFLKEMTGESKVSSKGVCC